MATREENALRAKAYRARKRAEKEAAATAGVVVQTTQEPLPDVSVTAAEPGPKLTLKERFMQRLSGQAGPPSTQPAKKRAPKKGKANTNLLTSVLPTLVATLVATWSQDLLPADYKQCAPSKFEVSAILGPLMDIIGRRIEVLGEASQDMIDLVTSLTCVLMYGTRAYITYVDIKKEKEQPGYAEAQERAYRAKLDREARDYDAVAGGAGDGGANNAPDLSGGLRAYQAKDPGRNGNGHSGHGSAAAQLATQDDAALVEPDPAHGDPEGRAREAALVADLFSRDRGGRVRLGLLPG